MGNLTNIRRSRLGAFLFAMLLCGVAVAANFNKLNVQGGAIVENGSSAVYSSTTIAITPTQLYETFGVYSYNSGSPISGAAAVTLSAAQLVSKPHVQMTTATPAITLPTGPALVTALGTAGTVGAVVNFQATDNADGGVVTWTVTPGTQGALYQLLPLTGARLAEDCIVTSLVDGGYYTCQ